MTKTKHRNNQAGKAVYPSPPQESKRDQLLKILVVATFLAFLAVVIGIAAIGSSQDENADHVDPAVLRGIQQAGNLLGDPDAPVTMDEIADLQCPGCRQFSAYELPAVLEGPVKEGKLKIRLRLVDILGPDSATAAKAAFAAGDQDQMWSFAEHFYALQGLEGAGYVTEEFLDDIANRAGVSDQAAWKRARQAKAASAELRKNNALKEKFGIDGTPSFILRGLQGKPIVLEGPQAAAAISDHVDSIIAATRD